MVDNMTPPSDYWAHTAHRLRDSRGRVVGYRMPRGGAGIDALYDRPPFKRLAGKRAVLAGRGRRASQSPEAIQARAELQLVAWRLRVTQGLTIRRIAAEVGRSPSLVGRWLRGIPPVGGAALDRLVADVERLIVDVERRADQRA